MHSAICNYGLLPRFHYSKIKFCIYFPECLSQPAALDVLSIFIIFLFTNNN